MFRRARELGPPVLVPLAWGFVTAAYLGVVAERTLFVAHVVMAVFLVGFAATGYADMREGLLQTWWWIVAVGSLVTLCGVVGLWLEPTNRLLEAVALFGWIGLPAIGFVETGRRVGRGTRIYVAGAAGCLFGAILFAGGQFWSLELTAAVGLALVGVGQTAGIVDAAVRY
ncbi:hypothetical protein [Natronobacterium gregoryi]|uniref:Uncharacterized protein n=2 Tax=Natronobacterium gregoryi TaxID=44930 RepID=L0AG99_NATGS|nr:hypothetical protein [Natronobacterium gregoryi]AFZ72841.1 hypothetical protein Natgr_1636 [Natronobacterium gregoryi SP2]ELY69671.1 hypothetical protein C490_07711 [Natronobacterium gregoryi SP2]PLK21930.1 hypothetical protein CYV19_02245 [Natronobacterium gregoryi SP2]SFI65491.1 hypothetical protein SAMN05443661_1031 [Natronobacterium gregoryi]